MITGENPSLLNDGDLSRVAVKLLLGIAEEWDLTEEQCCILAGIDAPATLQDWRQELGTSEPVINLPPATLKRLSYLVGIYKGLQVLFADPELRKSWIRKPHRDFGGTSVLDRMLAGKADDLVEVHRYVNSWCEEHYT